MSLEGKSVECKQFRKSPFNFYTLFNCGKTHTRQSRISMHCCSCLCKKFNCFRSKHHAIVPSMPPLIFVTKNKKLTLRTFKIVTRYKILSSKECR